jgi:hypothetical protein
MVQNAAKAVRLSGIVRRIHEAGLCYIQEEGTDRALAFTFDKIRNYRGESSFDLGLSVGSHVSFTATGDQIQSVEIGASNPH